MFFEYRSVYKFQIIIMTLCIEDKHIRNKVNVLIDVLFCFFNISIIELFLSFIS